MTINALRKKVQNIIQIKQLNSYMNDTKWQRLILFIESLPFEPIFQIKYLYYGMKQPESPTLFEDSFAEGLWIDEVLFPYFNIEWLCIRPRILIYQGKLISPKIESVETQLLQFLNANNIYFKILDDNIMIFGYSA